MSTRIAAVQRAAVAIRCRRRRCRRRRRRFAASRARAVTPARMRGAAGWIRASCALFLPYTPRRAAGGGRRVVKLNTNENPYPPSPAVLRRAARRGRRARGVLTPIRGVSRSREEACAALRRAGRRTSSPATAPTSSWRSRCARSIDPGDGVAFPCRRTASTPGRWSRCRAAKPIEVALAGRLVLPLGARDTGAKLTFLCNPNSPSGTARARRRIERARRAARAACWSSTRPTSTSPSGDCRARAACRRRRTSSSAHAVQVVLAGGLRVGLAFGDPELLRGLRTVKDSYSLNRLVAGGGA